MTCTSKLAWSILSARLDNGCPCSCGRIGDADGDGVHPGVGGGATQGDSAKEKDALQRHSGNSWAVHLRASSQKVSHVSVMYQSYGG